MQIFKWEVDFTSWDQVNSKNIEKQSNMAGNSSVVNDVFFLVNFRSKKCKVQTFISNGS